MRKKKKSVTLVLDKESPAKGGIFLWWTCMELNQKNRLPKKPSQIVMATLVEMAGTDPRVQ